MAAVLIRVTVFLGIIILAYVLKCTGLFRKEDFSIFSRIVLNLTLPCAVITNFSQLDMDYTFLLLVPMGLLANLTTLLIGYLVTFKKKPSDRAFYMINLSGYNIGSFAMPYITNFIGADGIVATCLFDAGNSIMCTGTTYPVASAVAGNGEKMTPLLFIKRMFRSIPMCTYLVMLLISIWQISLPSGILFFAKTVGDANGFMAMMMIGIGFEINVNKEQIARIIKLVGIRFLAAAAMGLLFFFLLPLPLEIRQVLVIISFAPISSICTAFTEKIGGDVALASSVNSISIIVGMLTMTALILSWGIGQ